MGIQWQGSDEAENKRYKWGVLGELELLAQRCISLGVENGFLRFWLQGHPKENGTEYKYLGPIYFFSFFLSLDSPMHRLQDAWVRHWALLKIWPLVSIEDVSNLLVPFGAMREGPMLISPLKVWLPQSLKTVFSVLLWRWGGNKKLDNNYMVFIEPPQQKTVWNNFWWMHWLIFFQSCTVVQSLFGDCVLQSVQISGVDEMTSPLEFPVHFWPICELHICSTALNSALSVMLKVVPYVSDICLWEMKC